MSVQIIQGDCRDVLASFADESFDCILTDPPYGETSLAWDRWPSGWPAAARRVLKRTGSMWVFGSMRMWLERGHEFSGWRFAQDVIWEKHNGSGFAADRFRRVHENALQFYRDDSPWAGVYRSVQTVNDAKARRIHAKKKEIAHTGKIGVHEFESVEGGPRIMRSVIFVRSMHHGAVHPTQKPEDIVEPLLLYSCPPGGLVLDCFAGSGTTGVVAARHGMSAVLIEGDAEYVKRISGRLAEDALLFPVSA